MIHRSLVTDSATAPPVTTWCPTARAASRAGPTVGGYAAWPWRSVWVKSGYQRRIHHLLNRGETRNSLARDVFHGHRGPAPQALSGRAGKPARHARNHDHATDMTRWALPEAGGDLHGQLPRADGPPPFGGRTPELGAPSSALIGPPVRRGSDRVKELRSPVLSGAVRDAQRSGRPRCRTWPAGHPGNRSSTACRTAD